MSAEQEIQDHFGIDPEDVTEEETEETTEEQEPEEETTEADEPEEEKEEPEKPLPKGFMTKEAWVESGKDPDEWVSPEVFRERSQRIKETTELKRRIREKEEDFDNRLKNLNALTQAQLKRQREELLTRRDDLIDVADREGVRKIDKELKDLDGHADLLNEKEEQKQDKPPEVVEWEEENPWCMNVEDPRLPVVQEAFAKAVKSGKTVAYALRQADKAVAEFEASEKPKGKDKKPPLQMADRGNSPGKARNDAPSISWNQLSSEEATMYEEFFEPTGMSKKDFLKTVADQRKGA